MWFDTVFTRFVEQSPFSVLQRATLEHILADSFLDDLFEEHACDQYCRELTFSAITSLLLAVVLRVRPSVRSAYRRRDDLPVTLKSVYDKLKGVEPAVCQALVREVARRCQGLLGHLPGAERPDPIPGMRLRVADGNFLAGTEHRLKVLRGDGAAALPGMSVALLDDRTGLITALLVREDAYTNERGMIPEVLACLEPRDLLVADRAYCTLELITGAADGGAAFVVRHHKQLHLDPQGEPAFVATTETAEAFEHQVHVGGEESGVSLRCLRLRLFAPTREGETEVVLLSDVPPERAGAATLADLYLRRWRIERSFQELTDDLRCEVETLAYPEAALLGFSLAVVAYNLLAVLKGAVAAEKGPDRMEQELSFTAVAREIARDSSGLAIALPPGSWRRFAEMTAGAMAGWMMQVVRGLNWPRYQKSKRGPKKPVAVKRGKRGSHRSTARLLQKRANLSQ